jgi:p24 family protein beta-1
MRFLTATAIAAMASMIGLSHGHNVQMKAHSKECFHEQLHRDDKMTVTFQVGDREFGGHGNLDIDFWVCCGYLNRLLQILLKVQLIDVLQVMNPAGAYQFLERGVSNGDHSFTATLDGKYTYCFSNEHWSSNTKEVSFNVHGIVYVPESEAPQDPLEQESGLS